MGAVLSFSVQLESTTCAACGVEFAMPPHLIKVLRENKREFYCPNGHTLSFNDSRADRLAKELEASKRELALKESALQLQRQRAEQFEAEAMKAARKLDRATNGTCPHCTRSFTNLRRHMETKHAAEVKAARPNARRAR